MEWHHADGGWAQITQNPVLAGRAQLDLAVSDLAQHLTGWWRAA